MKIIPRDWAGAGAGAGVSLALMAAVILTVRECFADEEIIIHRTSFPKGFVFGTASSAFQAKLLPTSFYTVTKTLYLYSSCF